MIDQLKALIVDDESELRKTVAAILESSFQDVSFAITEAENGAKALEEVKKQEYDIVLMDVRMPEMDGLTALKLIKEQDPRTFVVIMTAHSNLKDAVEAIKCGAYDYLEKPVQPEKLKELVQKALDARELVSSLALSNPILDDDVDSEFVGSSEKMRELFDLISRLSQVDTTVLVRGENGTGKELVARAIHFNSPRKHGDFVAINCGAIPEDLMESELFGHEKGSFTGAVERKIGKFQLANKGTIFLDEIGELRPDMQVKLLRVLQERKFVPVGGNREIKTNARIIAATNRNLEKMIEEGKFREDLFYRLNVMPLFLPPLRERLDDLLGLVEYFVRRFNRIHGRKILGVSDEAMSVLKSYRWPGNIRELENVIERAFIIESGTTITKENLPETVLEASEEGDQHLNLPSYYSGPMDYDRFKEESEKEFITAALSANQGRINKTVAEANIPKNTLLRKIKKYGINVKELNRE
ncbi:MAG: sigma-54-dependent Fis family transcriptional regulator [Bdellovibrionaceae bacterium]|nr:sigma-54-dependent Fis family transcriptional regulator [Bdellovibrionales bacterium]MCB9085886.1 sigma-54-dependent Fis family transcriptional regulator [Pseudobdellovibrionaceae bacterium]